METILLHEVDNSIERNIRLTLVAAGYWIDEALFIPTNDDAGWKAAMAALPLKIEVFGVGSQRDRVDVESPRVIVSRLGITKGDVGFQKKYYFEEIKDEENNITGYKKYQLGEGLFNVQYEIRYVCNSTTIDRVIAQAITNTFSFRKFLYGIKDNLEASDFGFYFIQDRTPIDLSGKNFIERLYRYRAVEIPVEQFKYIGDVANIDEFDFTIKQGESPDLVESSEIIE